MKRALILVLVQLIGVGVCVALASPAQHTSPATETAAAVLKGARFGPYLGAIATPSLEDFEPRVVTPPPEGLEAVIAARLGGSVELHSEQTGRYPFRWEDLGAVIVYARDADARRALVAQGYRLRDGVLSLPSGRDAPVTFGLRGERARDILSTIGRIVDRAPIRARWDFSRQRLISHRTGQRLDVETSMQRLMQTLIEGEARTELVIHEALPPASTQDLEAFDPGVKMAVFQTRFKKRKRDRTTNLKLASAAIDGTILMPGEVFSYNEVVGPRTAARGYKEAPVIVQGELVEGMGGGACQVSSTLHAAGLFAGLDIVRRSNHSLPSPYITKGLDAVVAWPNLDLKLRNGYDSPVVLHMYLKDDQVVAEILSDRPPERVLLRREVAEVISFKARVEVTTELEEGEVDMLRRGGNGYRISRGRIVWRDGKEHFEVLPIDVYKSRDRSVRIGPNMLYPPVEEEETAPAAVEDDGAEQSPGEDGG